MSNENQPRLLTNEISSQLPIFQILGNQLPEKLQTPEAKKTGAKFMFWAIFIAMVYGFVKILPTLLEIATKGILFGVLGIICVSLYLLSPKIVSLLYQLGNIGIFKARKATAEKFHMETLELLLEEADKTRKQVAERITRVQGLQISMTSDAQQQNEEAQNAFTAVKNLTTEAAATDKKAVEYSTKGDSEKAKKFEREAKEIRISATIKQSEGEAALQIAKSYAQYANQFGKGLEILKDNESASKIFFNLLKSSIKIIGKKIDATNKMKTATDGLADIFDVKDKPMFQYALGAATEQIAGNLAHIQRNLEFMSEKRLDNMQATKSQSELESFVAQLDTGKMKLNVREVSSADHELSKEETVDTGFSILG